jgi:thiamine pyrophosphate-dependent acetolactate synthase large subunit-like protein
MPAVEAVAAALPRDLIAAVDSTQLGYVGQNVWSAYTPRSWLAPAGFGTLGPALPLAIGAAAAAPERPCLAVVGDGSLAYTVEEMATAAQLGLSLVVLLWNNNGYGEIRDEMAAAGIEPVAVDATARDWGAIANGFGFAVTRPHTLTGLTEVLADALQHRSSTPVLVEVGPDTIA